MKADREQLVELITRQVLAAIQRSSHATAGESRRDVSTVAARSDTGPPMTLPVGAVSHDPTTCERCRNWGVAGVRGP